MNNLRLLTILFLCCLGNTLFISAQKSCFEQYLREHDMPFLIAEDADDSYEELKKTAIAYERMNEEAARTRRAAGQTYHSPLYAQPTTTFQPILLAIDTLSSTCHLLAQDGKILADAHLALVDSTWFMWLSVDPLADKNIANTPYMYCNGNPIILVDPDGRDWYVSTDDSGNKQYQFKEDVVSQESLNKMGIFKFYATI